MYNTCCVRENAENKALGNVIWLKELKKDKPELLICVGGCMTQEEGMAEVMKETISLHRSDLRNAQSVSPAGIPLSRAARAASRWSRCEQIDGEIVEGMPEHAFQ